MKPERMIDLNKVFLVAFHDEGGAYMGDISGKALLQQIRAEARQALIERCAQVCEQLPETEPALFASTPYNAVALTKQLCATAIRALQPVRIKDE